MDEYILSQQIRDQSAAAGSRSRIGSSEGRVGRALGRVLGTDWLGHLHMSEYQEDEYQHLERVHHARRERDKLFERQARHLEELLGGSSCEGAQEA